jgi:uncharacterized protein YifN (PemK superfamily)
MTINFTPKVGQILECDYGDYKLDASNQCVIHPDNHIPPEMIKNRLVVVLNGRLSQKSCIVVPLSTTFDFQKTGRGIHVEIPEAEIPDLSFFGSQVRWAKADLLQQVSIERLNRPKTNRGHVVVILSYGMVNKIQHAVIKTINASSLLQMHATEEAKANIDK